MQLARKLNLGYTIGKHYLNDERGSKCRKETTYVYVLI